jgi:hypothetical protein
MPGGRGRSRRASSGRRKPRDRDGLLEIQIGEGLDRHAVEALALEIRQLARRLGLDITTLTVDVTEDESSA